MRFAGFQHHANATRFTLLEACHNMQAYENNRQTTYLMKSREILN